MPQILKSPETLATPFYQKTVVQFENCANSGISLKAFSPFYRLTHLELLKHELNVAQVYLWLEVEAFYRVFYKSPDEQNPGDHTRMEKAVQPAVDRFAHLTEEEQEAFYGKLGAFISRCVGKEYLSMHQL